MVRHAKNEHVTLFVLYVFSVCSFLSLMLLFVKVHYYTQKEKPQISVVIPPPLFNKVAFDTVYIEGKA
jgi:hypothetical protein